MQVRHNSANLSVRPLTLVSFASILPSHGQTVNYLFEDLIIQHHVEKNGHYPYHREVKIERVEFLASKIF